MSQLNETLARLVAPNFGLLTYVSEVQLQPVEPDVFIAVAEYQDPKLVSSYSRHMRLDANDNRQASGAGLDRESALWSTVGEAVERYASSVVDIENLEYATLNQLEGDKLDPRDMILFADWQYQLPNFPFHKFCPNKPFGWVKGFNLTKNCESLLPARFVYLDYVSKYEHESIDNGYSTGLAAGPNVEAAICSGIREVIERDAFSCYFLNEISPPQLDFCEHWGKLPEKLQKVLDCKDIDYYVSNLTTEFNVPCVMSILKSGNKLGFSTGTSCHLKGGLALEKAVVESFHTFNWILDINRWQEPITSSEQVYSFADHVCYYLDETRHKDIAFLTDQAPAHAFEINESDFEGDGFSDKSELNYLVDLLAQHGYQDQREDVFADLYPMLQHQELLALFSSLLDKLPLHQHNRLTFFTGDTQQVYYDEVSRVANLSKVVAGMLEQPQPSLLINYTGKSEHPPFAIRVSDGAGVIYAPKRILSDNELAHEITHCIVTTGHHFLDEALSYYIESRFSEESVSWEQLLPLDYCLQVSHIDQLEGIDSQDVNNIYCNGILLIDLLLEHMSAAQLVELYKRIPLLIATKKLVKVFEELIGQQWQQLVKQTSTLKLTDEQESSSCEEQQLSTQINQAYFSGLLAQVSEILPSILVYQNSQERATLMAIVRGLFSALCYEDDQEPSMRLTFQTLCERIQSQSANSEDSFVCSILTTCLDMSRAKSYIEIQELAAKITATFDTGLAAFPDSGELNLMKGKSLFDIPEVQGGNKVQARQHFEIATKDPDYGANIMQLVANYY